MSRVINYDPSNGSVLYLFDEWRSIEELFFEWEMKVDDIWQPVGKLEV